MPVMQLKRPETTPAPGHGDESSRAFTFCSAPCERCDLLMAERAIEIKAAMFAMAFGRPGSRSWIEAKNRYMNHHITRLDMATAEAHDHPRFQRNAAFDGAFDKGRLAWVDDMPVSV